MVLNIASRKKIFDSSQKKLSKAETLEYLGNVVKEATILPQVRFTVGDWKKSSESIMQKILHNKWGHKSLIVRSSALNEDSAVSSLAGHYDSVLKVIGKEALLKAINKVCESFKDKNEEDQIFIQPCIEKVAISGVVFTKDPSTGGFYIIVNYDDDSGSTDTVTSGASHQTKTVFVHRTVLEEKTRYPFFEILIPLIKKLEEIFDSKTLDIEFAIDKEGKLYLFQARYLTKIPHIHISESEHANCIQRIHSSLERWMKPHPYLLGSTTVFGVMPDWNPAEIVGRRPKPLALSLYREIVTDAIWAYQRDNYGYRNLRSFPLLIEFEGLPYIDVRVSFNSFIPASLPEEIGKKLVDYYIKKLVQNPSLHDKVEFDIVFSCYTFDLKERLEILKENNFSEEEITQIYQSLKNLTSNILTNGKKFWINDVKKISFLKKRYQKIAQSELDPISKMYWFIEDCKRYGTLPFAGLARAGFIAIQLLKSLVAQGILTQDNFIQFLNSLQTISTEMSQDFSTLSKTEFLSKYGHLRPGTYDITSPRYDEAADSYFNWEETIKPHEKIEEFSLSLSQLRRIQKCLDDDNLNIDVLNLFEFIKQAIEYREYAKFVFSKSVSDFLKTYKEFCLEHNISLEEASYTNINAILALNTRTTNSIEQLKRSISEGIDLYKKTCCILLPDLICDPHQAFEFSELETNPNFITLKSGSGKVINLDSLGNFTHQDNHPDLTGAIVFIRSADPGYDWIFSHKINGFVTQYGGINSHMAIRAAELNIPAVIGAGEKRYCEWAKEKFLTIDCVNRKVEGRVK